MVSFRNANYWWFSKQPRIGALFVLPLWLTYEFAAERVSAGLNHGARTGLHNLLRESLSAFSLPASFSTVLIFGLFVMLLLVPLRRAKGQRFRLPYFWYMLLESIVYAAVLGLIVGAVTGFILNMEDLAGRTLVARLVSHIGAGIYEELFFRVGILTVLATLLHRSRHFSVDSSRVMALLFSSFFFAAFHYLPTFGVAFELTSFVFRFWAGMVLGSLFLLRGFGITAYAHAFYNIFLTFR